jgi:hypothetical protein
MELLMLPPSHAPRSGGRSGVSLEAPVLCGAVFHFTRVPFEEPVDIVAVFFI